MSIRLLVTSGRGPAECRIAVGLIVETIRKEASARDIDVAVIEGPHHSQGHGPASVVLALDGPDETVFARTWTGTVQWIAQSPVRPHHKRKNWFVSVSVLSQPPLAVMIDLKDVQFETFRAGGPGGQHQNTTDSAVRALHRPTGLRAIARDERSQHRNRDLAVERLAELLHLQRAMAEGALQQEAQALHDSLERGNPVKVLRG